MLLEKTLPVAVRSVATIRSSFPLPLCLPEPVQSGLGNDEGLLLVGSSYLIRFKAGQGRRFGKQDFVYFAQDDVYRCPAGDDREPSHSASISALPRSRPQVPTCQADPQIDAGHADRGDDFAQIRFSNPYACKSFSDDEHLRAVFSDTISTIFKMSLRHIAQRL
jgi:hypothetical protein